MAVYGFKVYETKEVFYHVEADTQEKAEEMFDEFYNNKPNLVFHDIDDYADSESDYELSYKAGDVLEEAEWNFRAPGIYLAM